MHKLFIKKYCYINKFKSGIINKLDNNTAIIYRNYSKKHNIKEILKIKRLCQKKNISFYLANNIKLAIRLKTNGVYIPSFNKNFKHLSYKLTKKFEILGSAHNIKEMKIKEKQGASYLFLSSIFKKNNNYLGINRFRNFSKYSNLKIIALGGVSKQNLKKLNLVNCKGFAGISYFG